jgi:hypothetical protein
MALPIRDFGAVACGGRRGSLPEWTGEAPAPLGWQGRGVKKKRGGEK